MSEIRKKVLAIQTSMKCGKTQFNSFGNYNYRSAEGILEALKPHLLEQGLIVNLTDKIELVGDQIYVSATVSLIDVDDGETVSTVGWAREPREKKGMDTSQITGTASSYARKYALNGLLALDDTKDADTDEYQRQTGSKAPAIKCETCGRPITGYTSRSGVAVSAQDFAGYTAVKLGRKMCKDCAQKTEEEAAAARKAAAAARAEKAEKVTA